MFYYPLAYLTNETNKQTDRHTDTLIAIPHTPPGGDVIMKEQAK